MPGIADADYPEEKKKGEKTRWIAIALASESQKRGGEKRLALDLTITKKKKGGGEENILGLDVTSRKRGKKKCVWLRGEAIEGTKMLHAERGGKSIRYSGQGGGKKKSEKGLHLLFMEREGDGIWKKGGRGKRFLENISDYSARKIRRENEALLSIE